MHEQRKVQAIVQQLNIIDDTLLFQIFQLILDTHPAYNRDICSTNCASVSGLVS